MLIKYSSINKTWCFTAYFLLSNHIDNTIITRPYFQNLKIFVNHEIPWNILIPQTTCFVGIMTSILPINLIFWTVTIFKRMHFSVILKRYGYLRSKNKRMSFKMNSTTFVFWRLRQRWMRNKLYSNKGVMTNLR